MLRQRHTDASTAASLPPPLQDNETLVQRAIFKHNAAAVAGLLQRGASATLPGKVRPPCQLSVPALSRSYVRVCSTAGPHERLQ